MQYTKPALTFDQQADLLIRRGMGGDRALLVNRLKVVNYYRLSAYWYPFRNPDNSFRKGTTFEEVWARYVFDRRLRTAVMDAIERVEVALRTQLAYEHAHRFGNPFAYAEDPMALPNLTSGQRGQFVERIADEAERSKETFVKHFRCKYGRDHPFMPVWMATEIMTFGCVLTFYKGADTDVQKRLAVVFGVHDKVLDSWLLALNTIRNICAHHGRLWNRVLGNKPKIPRGKNDLRWHRPVPVGNDRLFGILTILKHCLDRVAPQSQWPDRIRDLLQRSPHIPQESMGFPPDWQDCPIWKSHP